MAGVPGHFSLCLPQSNWQAGVMQDTQGHEARLQGRQRTLGNGTAVEGAGGRPAAADAVEGAVAEAAAGWTLPRASRLHLQDILPVAHEQAVPAEHPLHRTLCLPDARRRHRAQGLRC